MSYDPKDLEKIVEHVSDAIYAFDKDWRFTYLNTAAERYWGYSREELLGQFAWGKFPDCVGGTFYKAYLQAVREQIDVYVEAYAPLKGKWVSLQATPVDDGLLVCARDISEQKEYKLRMETLVELSPSAFRLVDGKGNHLDCNQAYIDLFQLNCSKADLVGKPLEYIYERIGLQLKAGGAYQALQGKEVKGSISQIKDKVLLVNAVPVKVEQDIVGAMIVIHDISEYEKIRKEIHNMDRLNLIGQMAAGVAHEIRNPLTAVKGYLQFLQRKVPQNLLEQFQIALTELGRVEELIIDFLSLARNRTDEKRISNLNNLIRESLPLLQPEAIKRDMSVRVNLGPSLPDQCLDEKEIKQVILNLSRNAFEAMSKHGTLTLETAANDKEIILLITDTGAGIPCERINKIFDPFFTTKDKGTGLGLAICESIIKNHGGTIEVKSELEIGTSFIIRFSRSSADR